MEKKFTKPEMEIIIFAADDVIVASGLINSGDEPEDGDINLPWPLN